MPLLIKNIKELIQVEEEPRSWVAGTDMARLETISDAFIYIEGERIARFGTMGSLAESGIDETEGLEVIDASGRMVFPSFVDSHTHLVYPASREIEYMDKIRGLSYEEIARRGGGILNSSRRMQEISEEELLIAAKARLEEIIRFGTGAVEIKSGYGLTLESELKMLRVIRKLRAISPLQIKATFSVPVRRRCARGRGRRRRRRRAGRPGQGVMIRNHPVNTARNRSPINP